MAKRKQTRKALVLSVVSLLLCVAMLAGTTFAWFTDSVTSGQNKIVAGNLDVEFEYKDANGEWQTVTANTDLFHPTEGDAEDLWEPGHTEVVYLRVRNAGTLALAYALQAAAYGDTEGGPENAYTNMAGEKFKLSEHLVFNVLESAEEIKSREDAWIKDEAAEKAALGNLSAVNLSDIGTVLYPAGTEGEDKPFEIEFALAVYMPTWVGNEANQLTDKIDEEGQPTLYLGLTLLAKQTPFEEDSFGNTYDENASFDFTLVSNADFEEAWNNAKNGDALMLLEDVTVSTIKVDKTVTIALNGNNLTVTDGIELSTENTLTVMDGTMDPITLKNEGSLNLDSVDITATNAGESAITLDTGAKVNLTVGGTSEYTGATGGHGINVPEGTSLTLSGSGSLTVVGNGGKEDVVTGSGASGSGIRADGDLVIDGLSHLTAEGYGYRGFGIGGSASTLTISKTTIDHARGGHAQATPVSGDEKYGKNGEGMPAIGLSSGGTLTLENVTVEKAEGGIKSAAIGSSFHTGITLNITGCTLGNITGGATAAAIGGGRANNVETCKVTIAITNSTITNAQGGTYGAGIGSGYDTECSGKPSVDIQITDSNVTAKGGQYAAGIGTGYHVGVLSGFIKGGTVNASKPDDAFYKPEYTTAQAIGYGVVDPGREFQNPNVTFTVDGQVIEPPTPGN